MGSESKSSGSNNEIKKKHDEYQEFMALQTTRKNLGTLVGKNISPQNSMSGVGHTINKIDRSINRELHRKGLTDYIYKACGPKTAICYFTMTNFLEKILSIDDRSIYEKIRRLIIIGTAVLGIFILSYLMAIIIIKDLFYERIATMMVHLTTDITFIIILIILFVFPKRNVETISSVILTIFGYIDIDTCNISNGGFHDGCNVAGVGMCFFFSLFVFTDFKAQIFWFFFFIVNIFAMLIVDFMMKKTNISEIPLGSIRRDLLDIDIYIFKLYIGYICAFGSMFLGAFITIFKFSTETNFAKKVITTQMKVIDKYKVIGDELNELVAEKKAEQKIRNFIPTVKINKKLFKINPNDIKLIKQIGKGGSDSSIYKADWVGTIIAYKLFRTKDFIEQGDYDNFEREVSILSSINHPNIIQFYGCTMTKTRVGILLEYCENGDLKYFLKKHKNELNFDEKIRILIGLIRGVKYLHDRYILHRDLKPQNILLDQTKNVKLIDFGISRIFSNMNTAKTVKIGTKYYVAPEITLGEDYDWSSDVFSLSIIFYELLTENLSPYNFLSRDQLMQVELKVGLDPKCRPKFEDESKYIGMEWFIDLIKKMWDHTSTNRPKIEEILECLKEKSFLKIKENINTTTNDEILKEEE